MSGKPSSYKGKGKKGVVGFVDTGHSLQDTYGEDRLVILPRDPYWMFAYWEITEKKRKQIRAKYGKNIFEKAQLVLRVHDVTDMKRFTGKKSHSFKDVSVSIDTKNWYVNVDYPGKSWCIELGLKTPKGRFIVILRSNIINLPSGRVSNITDEQWMLMTEDYEKLLKLSGVDKIGVGSLEMTKFLAKRWELLNIVSSGVFSSVTSRGFKVPWGNPREFRLVAETELIVYGATEPSATLTINDKSIKLNPDGTFSLRVDFPDGKKQFAIKSVSDDKVEQRKITITAQRKTK